MSNSNTSREKFSAHLVDLEGRELPPWLAGTYLWSAVLADLHRRCGQDEQAERYRHDALALAPSAAVWATLARRLDPAGHGRP